MKKLVVVAAAGCILVLLAINFFGTPARDMMESQQLSRINQAQAIMASID